MSTKVQVDSGGGPNAAGGDKSNEILESYDAVQLDLLSGQLSIRSK